MNRMSLASGAVAHLLAASLPSRLGTLCPSRARTARFRRRPGRWFMQLGS